jgi:4-amino-4-deoxy-L-arabinose transferase-like glycosyltransferase
MTASLRTRLGEPATVVWTLVLLVVIRLVSLGLYPLTDNTEARYAEIGRVMAQLGDWVTPWYDTGVPFWGKPPLSFWATAGSFQLLGVSEFSARLPHFLAALCVAWLMWGWARRESRSVALTAVALLGGSSLMLVASGAVMTDMMLTLGTTLALRGFWLGLHGDPARRKTEGWLLFVGLAVGLLAKGPLMLVLTGVPLGLWSLFSGQLGRVWRDLPWVRGLLLTLVLAAPWYVLAEARTPGFLDYFLVGEHWHRFVTPGWSGDRYGVAHSAARGSIWIYAIVALLPWSVLLPLGAWRQRRQTGKLANETATAPSSQRYLLLWAFTPLAFFTMAGNILWTYVLPALAPLTLFGAHWLHARWPAASINRLLTLGLGASALLFAAFVVGLNTRSAQDWHTTRQLVAHHAQLAAPDQSLSFYPVRPYSAAFYSRGHAREVAQIETLRTQLDGATGLWAMKPGDWKNLPTDLRTRLTPLAQHGEYLLLGAPGETPPAPT